MSRAHTQPPIEPPRERVVMARVLRSEPDDGLFDLEFWGRVGPEGRFAAAWEMIADVDRFRGGDGRQPRLQRTVCRLQRR